jgi:hypothetical protein
MALIRCSECQKEISDKADSCPSCGAPVAKSQPKRRRGGFAILVILALFVLALFAVNNPQQGGSDRSNGAPTSQPSAAAKIPSTPEELVSKLLDTPEAEPNTTEVGEKLLVSYSLKPWSLTNWSTKTAFNSNVFKIVPKAFETFPEIQEIEITGNGLFIDVKGNESTKPAIRAAFTRANSSTVHWDKAYEWDVPKFADEYWAHPSLRD